MNEDVLSIWVVYDHPKDRPECYVARRHEVHPTGPRPTADVIVGGSLEDVRARLPGHLHRVPRDPRDEKYVMELWL